MCRCWRSRVHCPHRRWWTCDHSCRIRSRHRYYFCWQCFHRRYWLYPVCFILIPSVVDRHSHMIRCLNLQNRQRRRIRSTQWVGLFLRAGTCQPRCSTRWCHHRGASHCVIPESPYPYINYCAVCLRFYHRYPSSILSSQLNFLSFLYLIAL